MSLNNIYSQKTQNVKVQIFLCMFTQIKMGKLEKAFTDKYLFEENS